jgi:hypothetical protein
MRAHPVMRQRDERKVTEPPTEKLQSVVQRIENRFSELKVFADSEKSMDHHLIGSRGFDCGVVDETPQLPRWLEELCSERLQACILLRFVLR